ncbi:hypothetical protein K461DRAFT_263983 [Myriangium duriaei CBS 260.36]|uniref:Uncharacterized protein n=1 Tax=Myriangium duriaei CBS 260.36 TaxID=1168546 RepID=A0A9P4J7Y8_9PEZI|nr:hypothetical protein K461DRAFT_263983 [Myriangium duriaei CBS 260.36]
MYGCQNHVRTQFNHVRMTGRSIDGPTSFFFLVDMQRRLQIWQARAWWYSNLVKVCFDTVDPPRGRGRGGRVPNPGSRIPLATFPREIRGSTQPTLDFDSTSRLASYFSQTACTPFGIRSTESGTDHATFFKPQEIFSRQAHGTTTTPLKPPYLCLPGVWPTLVPAQFSDPVDPLKDDR